MDLTTVLSTENIIVSLFVVAFLGIGFFLRKDFWPWLKDGISHVIKEYFDYQKKKLDIEENRIRQNELIWKENNELIKQAITSFDDRLSKMNEMLIKMTALTTQSHEQMLNTMMKLASREEVIQEAIQEQLMKVSRRTGTKELNSDA